MIRMLILAGALLASAPSFAQRVIDLVEVEGVRQNQLSGYGLVIGLDGTGDRSTYINRAIEAQLTKYGFRLPEGINISARNAAVVVVSAELDPFKRTGQTIDVTVSSIGNAKSLKGGSLIASPLLGLDGNVYAVAQGQVLVDGLSAEGLDGSTVQVNTTTVGRIPGGATIERYVDTAFTTSASIRLTLNEPNYETAANIANEINSTFGAGTATAVDAGLVDVASPAPGSSRVDFLAAVQNLDVEVGRPSAQVTVNSRTGTVSISENVILWPVAISEGRWTISVSEASNVYQPRSFSGGDTIVTANSEIQIEQTQGQLSVVAQGEPTLSDLVEAFNRAGTAPKDMAHLLQLLKKSGSLRAKLVVI
ncbi:flagellar basal body P-ring protein FlgI [Ferrimonas marina]|uniref:Flagellar P-ring protein n=1 Tax=Ferrimonas marina TaxID=299255 RepID=A0A1M5TF67_9GAMM|nr:flagellar basal body P-ring protein FlgI [Ferrimonas marina]SHH49407.1 flagellar P-ring protein precursor FlgI [Ferrimonas marina]